jgi:hypothetical protein
MKMKNGEEMQVAIRLPLDGELPVITATVVAPGVAKKTPTVKGAKPGATKKPVVAPVAESPESRIKCTVAWCDRKGSKAGIVFGKLSDVQKKALEELMRNSLLL